MSKTELFKRRKYRNPPVVEAVARFNLNTPIPWNITTPGILFEHLKEEYPTQPEVRNQIQAEQIQNAVEGQGSSTKFSFGPASQEMLFFNESRDKFIMISAASISAHCLVPYAGWEELETRLLGAYERIKDLLPEEDLISQCCIRYINRIELPTQHIDLEKFLTVKLNIPSTLPQVATSFFDRVEILYPKNEAKLIFTLASVEAKENHTAFVIDLDLSTPVATPVGISEGLTRLRTLKGKETQAFEGFILDGLREVFVEFPE